MFLQMDKMLSLFSERWVLNYNTASNVNQQNIQGKCPLFGLCLNPLNTGDQ